jgi:hypothetical protein
VDLRGHGVIAGTAESALGTANHVRGVFPAGLRYDEEWPNT